MTLNSFEKIMTSQLAQLRQQKDEITDQIKDLMTKHPGAMPSDVANRIDEMLSQAERLNGKIDAINEEAQRAGDEHAQSGWKNSAGEPTTVLRNAADIRKHYAAQQHQEPTQHLSVGKPPQAEHRAGCQQQPRSRPAASASRPQAGQHRHRQKGQKGQRLNAHLTVGKGR